MNNMLPATKNKTSVGHRAFNSSLWQIFGGGTQTIIRITASIFLARMLTPYDFGIFGMGILVKDLLAHIGAFGMSAGLIAKETTSQEDLCTCFWSMSFFRILMLLGCFFGAPVAAYLWGDSSLEKVVKAISFIFFVSIFEIIPYAILTKELNFKAINIIRNVGCLLESLAAVYLVYATNLSYWSLIIAMFVNLIFCNTLLTIVTKWVPRFKFSRASFKFLLPYGLNSLGFSFTNYLSQNLDYLLVGRLLGAENLGLYEFAYRIPHLIYERISKPIGQVAFPALSKLQGEKHQLITGFINAVKYVSLVCIPCLTGLATLASLVVPLLWGEQWVSIIMPLQILCLCSALRIITQPVGSVFYCLQLPQVPFKASFAGLLITAAVVSLLGLHFGITGVSIGMLSSTLAPSFLVWLAFKKTDTSLNLLMRELFPIVIASFFCAIASLLTKLILPTSLIHPTYTLLLSIAAGAMAYLSSLILLFEDYTKQIVEEVEPLLPFDIPHIIRDFVVR